MISFVSLFLGLVAGIHPVELTVGAPVASVEIRLDGRTVGSLAGPPWVLRCDFGKELRPHQLEALAHDSAGKIIGSCRQSVNLPRPPVEAQIVLERDEHGVPVAATVTWESLEFPKAESIVATLDGSQLAASGGARFRLPALPGARLHLLTAEAQFPRHLVARAEVALGGANLEAVASELTALPVVLRQGTMLAGPEPLEGRLLEDGRRLRVVAAEKGPADVIVVVDLQAARIVGSAPFVRAVRSKAAASVGMGEDDGVRFMIPCAETKQNRTWSVHLFDLSQRFTPEDGDVPRLLAFVASRFPTGKRQSIADAVAVAAVRATERNSRRAVVLMLGGGRDDQSDYSVSAVRDFLESLRVPLFVWSVVRAKPGAARSEWGEAEDASSAGSLDVVVGRLRQALEGQRIVWVEVGSPGTELEFAL